MKEINTAVNLFTVWLFGKSSFLKVTWDSEGWWITEDGIRYTQHCSVQSIAANGSCGIQLVFFSLLVTFAWAK